MDNRLRGEIDAFVSALAEKEKISSIRLDPPNQKLPDLLAFLPSWNSHWEATKLSRIRNL